MLGTKKRKKGIDTNIHRCCVLIKHILVENADSDTIIICSKILHSKVLCPAFIKIIFFPLSLFQCESVRPMPGMFGEIQKAVLMLTLVIANMSIKIYH